MQYIDTNKSFCTDKGRLIHSVYTIEFSRENS